MNNSVITGYLKKPSISGEKIMRLLTHLRDFAVTFIIVFTVTLVVGYLYNLLVHGLGEANLETAFQLALIFGIVFPLLGRMESAKQR